MFRSDWIFSITLCVLIVVAVWSTFAARPGVTSTVVINGTATNTVTITQEPPYTSFFSALGSASIIVLAWERVAHSRKLQLRHLMNRVCPVLFGALLSIQKGVWGRKDSDLDDLEQSIKSLKRYGCFHSVDRLYPSNAVEELVKLQSFSRDYMKDWSEFRKQLEDFNSSHGLQNTSVVEEVLVGTLELRELHDIGEGGQPVNRRYVPLVKKGTSWERASGAELPYEVGQQLISLRERMSKESDYLRKLSNELWARELVQRASRIRSDFEAFLDEHDIEIRQQDVYQAMHRSIF